MESRMVDRIIYLISELNKANQAYYSESREIMSNKEYDGLYDELLQLEEKTGIIMSNSPTHKIGCEIVSSLSKVTHETPIQSLDKTKSVDELRSWLGDQEGVMSWKLDGLTVVLTYEKGKLTKAVTRGNGIVGEDITNNVKHFLNLPLTIQTTCDIITIRGEAVITYPQFEKINSEISVPYKNPRNLCSGTIRQLNSQVVKDRGVRFIAFELVTPVMETITDSFKFLEQQGFDVVDHRRVDQNNFDEVFEYFKTSLDDNEFPTDGLVLRYNDYEYGEGLGRTDKFPKHSLAFKWKDETVTTILRDVEWSTARSGVITPVAVFDPVELEGTTVSRASLHNVGILEELQLGIGDEITIYKANMIIPQVDDNLTRSGTYQVPNICPDCGHEAVVKENQGSKILCCTNPRCNAKLLARLTHFVSRECMNIDGLSEETLKKMIDNGWITSFGSIYRLSESQKMCNEMMRFPGFGRKSVINILTSVEKSKNVRLDNFINAMGISGIGKKQSKQIAEYFKFSCDDFNIALEEKFDFKQLDGFGEVLNKSIHDWYSMVDRSDYYYLCGIMDWIMPNHYNKENVLSGKTFVITGKTETFANRKALQEKIESCGGIVSGAVSSKTDYLINNDVTSTSGKNKKALELGVQIISEADLITMIGG